MSDMSINTNVSAMEAIDNLDNTGNALAGVTEDLSTGLQINNAGDNPAGYVISQDLEFQTNGTNQAIQNAQGGVNMIQTANGALEQIQGILQTMNTLAVDSASGATNDTVSLNANQQEFVALENEINQIAQTTSFAGNILLNGGLSGATIQIGYQSIASNQIVLTVTGATIAALGLSGFVAAGGSVNIVTAASAASALASIQAAINTCASMQSALGATQIELTGIISSLSVTSTNLAAANASLIDVNFAQETTQFTTDQILEQSGVSMLSQAQQTPALVLKLLQ
jgi:flagellin